MKRRKGTSRTNQPRRDLVEAPDRNKAQRPVLLFGLCKPGLVVVTVAYVLLASAEGIEVGWHPTASSKLMALVAYTLLASLCLYKAYRVWCGKGALRTASRLSPESAGRRKP
jgi:hypothetical protein